MKKSSIMMMAVCALALCTLCAVPANAGEYFKKTEVQLHADFARDKGFKDANGEDIEESIITATFAHVSEWKYGDNFGFFDLEGKDDYEFGVAQYYGEFATRVSLDKVILGAGKNGFLPIPFIKESYLKLELNSGSPAGGFDYIDDALLYGVSFDLNLGQPNFGFSNLSFQVKDFTAIDERNNSEKTWQVTLAWGQPFSIGSVNFDFQGFFDVWEYNDEVVILTEPQLRMKLDSFVGKGNFLSDTSIGIEIEISKRFFNQSNSDVLINPTLFWAMTF